MWPKIPRSALENRNILVVDDDPASLQVARLILFHYSARVFTAWNGEEGLKIARSTQLSFIVSDLSMPVMDGWTMLRCLKEDTLTARIPVIALTAHAMVGDRERALTAGFHNYLTKPLAPSTFICDLLKMVGDIPNPTRQLLDGEINR